MKKLLFISGLLALPVLVLAQGGGNLSNTKLLLTSFRQVITTLTIIAASLALLVFIWGLVKYIANAEDEGAKEGGRRLMVQGAIALFVLFAIFPPPEPENKMFELSARTASAHASSPASPMCVHVSPLSVLRNKFPGVKFAAYIVSGWNTS